MKCSAEAVEVAPPSDDEAAVLARVLPAHLGDASSLAGALEARARLLDVDEPRRRAAEAQKEAA